MSISRRQFISQSAVTALAAPAIIVPGRASAQQTYTMKYANNLPASHPMNVRAREMADNIAKETNGRVKLQVFPSSQLGSDTDVLSQVRSGGVEFFTLSGLILATLVPAAAITGVGFAFDNYASVWKALDGDLGAYVRGQIGRANLVVMDKIWDNGFRQITSSTKPIRTADDLKDFKIRVPVSPMWTSMFKAFGSAPTSINFSEVYSALQTHVVDGQENPIALLTTAKLYEVQKYCSLTNHMWDGFWFLANKRAWERLPEDLRTIVARNINAAGMQERADVAKLNATVQQELVGKGMVFNEAKSDSFRARLRQAGYYDEWKSKFGAQPWAILERSMG